MQSKIQRLLHTATPQEVDEFSHYTAVVCELSHLYPTALAEKKIREQIMVLDEGVWGILRLIYTHKVFTLDELRHWLYMNEIHQWGMRMTLSSKTWPTTDIWSLQWWDIQEVDEPWVTVKWSGKVYKRTLVKDLSVVLK
jgi:hypothetical protein